MFKKMKYVSFSLDGKYPDEFLIFSNVQNHSDIAKMFISEFPGYKPFSAGFVNVSLGIKNEIIINVFGYSKTLGIESNPMDKKYIENMILDDF